MDEVTKPVGCACAPNVLLVTEPCHRAMVLRVVLLVVKRKARGAFAPSEAATCGSCAWRCSQLTAPLTKKNVVLIELFMREAADLASSR